MNRVIVRALAMTAYEQGWKDACNDHLVQKEDPNHPIGQSKCRDAFSLLHVLDPYNLLKLR